MAGANAPFTLWNKTLESFVPMTAEGSDQLRTIRNPARGQLGCDALGVERDAPVLHLPASLTLGQDRVACARVAVLRQARGGHVHEQLALPHSHVREMQVSEGDCRRAFLADEPPQYGLVGVRPEMLVVGLGVRVDDQQLVVVLTDANCEGERLQPRAPAFAD